MALDDDIRVLSGVNLFDCFTREQVRLLAFGAETIPLGSGRTLYREGDKADCAFVVAEGRIGLYRRNGEEARRVALVGPQEILGEYALIAPGVRLTDAAAETDAQLIRINRTLFRRILEEYPDTALALQRRLTGELEALMAKIEAVAARLGR